ncbi:MAG: phage tail protein [Synergistaceae bacterium]|nr:phage tail protein [Synergistaceae bacterium]
MIQLNISNAMLERAVSNLRSVQSQMPQALARAVNRTTDGLRTDAVKETHKKYFVSAKDVRASISFRKATAGSLMGAMVSKGKRHSLADYQLTPNRPQSGRKAALKGAVKREGGLKPLGPAFLIKRAGGRYFPFYRVGSGSGNRYKGIQSLISPSMPQIIKNEETLRVMEQGAQERFAKRVDHEISLILDALTR